MTSLGIMTLSRGPYSELDKMSLFQDLKLKRRKVDSRCSSDGESIADTSTSSPDLLQPLSPKMCDQQQSAHQNPKGTSLAISDDGLQKDTPEALTSPPTTPSTADEEHEQQVCTSASGYDPVTNDLANNSAASNETHTINTSNSYHSKRLNGNELNDGNASSHQQDRCISVSYQDDDSDPADDRSLATAMPSMSGYDNGTVANTANFKDEAYGASHIASPECSPDVSIEERAAAARNGGRGSASNVTAASVIRSVADERRPRSVNPLTISITTATTTKEQASGSNSSGGGGSINSSSNGGGSNATTNNKCGRLDSTTSGINIQASHNTNNNRCAATTTTASTSDAAAGSKSINATLPLQYQHYSESSAGVEDDHTAPSNGMVETDSANANAGNVRAIAGSVQTQQQQHVTVLVTPALSRMKNNYLATAEGKNTGNAATAAAAAAAAATTLVTLGMRKQQSLLPLSTALTESTSPPTSSSSTTTASSSSMLTTSSSISNSSSTTSNGRNFNNNSQNNNGIPDRMQNDRNEGDSEHHHSRQNTQSPPAIGSSTPCDTATIAATTTTTAGTISSVSPSVSLSFQHQSSSTGPGGLSSKIVSSQVNADVGSVVGANPKNPNQPQHVIITQQQMLQAMHQQIRIKKERQQQQMVVTNTAAQGNHRPMNTSFSPVHQAQQLIIKRERSVSGGLKLPNATTGSSVASHATIVRQSANSPGLMVTPMQPPLSPQQSLPYRQASSPAQVGSSCGNQQPQVIVKRERGSSIHQQQFQHPSSSIANSVCVSVSNPIGNFASNSSNTTTTSSVVSTVGSLSIRNPIRDAAILFRVKNETNAANVLSHHNQQQQQQQQLQQQHHRMVWPGPTALAATAVVSSGATTPHRINGVKPEVIGGPLPPIRSQLSSPHHHAHQQQQQQQQQQQSPHQQQQPLQQSPQHHHGSPGPIASQTPPRATPTVIMGESCGVRTMVWSYDTALQQVHNTASSNTMGGGNSSAETVPGIATVSGGMSGNSISGAHLQHHHHQQQQQLTHHQHLQSQHTSSASVTHHHQQQQQGSHQANGGTTNTGNGSIITSNSNNSSSHNNVSPTSNNEEAAHLLLSLGQSVVPTTSPTAAVAVAAAAAAVVAGHTQAWQSANHPRTNLPLNMERLWAGDYGQFSTMGSQQQHQQHQALNLTSQQQQQPQQQHLSWSLSGTGTGPKKEILDDMPPDEDDQPLVCMICEDKATGLHYGIITCEGCKGFFKRTVQNRRVYTCVADGTCEITKAQRNRCQYCRFKKCIEQGMVLQAVREDRMPGGRNSGAVYNLYKVKYKKHKKNNQKSTNAKIQQGTGAIGTAITNLSDIGVGAGGPLGSGIASVGSVESPKSTNMYHHSHVATHLQQHHHLPSTTSPTMVKSESMNLNLMNGTILKTALTNPSEIVHLRHRLDNAVSSSKDRSISYEQALNMIHTLIDCDAMEDIATLPHFSEFLADKSEIGDKLCNIGDSIVHKLVSWTRKLPFYTDIPVEIHTKLLTDKWHEILVLTTAAYQAMHGKKNISTTQTQSGSGGIVLAPDKNDPEFTEEITSHLHTLQSCLTTLMGHPISIEQLKIDVGQMVEKMTQITIMFRRIKLKMEEYVCLKVYILLNKEVELESIQERYIQVLRSYLQHTVPHNPNRLSDLLAHIPEIQTAASLLLESKMFYVPFVLNSANIR